MTSDKEHRKVLEIGFGGNPLSMTYWHPVALSRGGLLLISQRLPLLLDLLPPDVTYYGIDHPSRLSPEEIASSPKWCRGYVGTSNAFFQEYRKIEPSPEKLIVEEMDARNMSYPSATFDEVHMHYVLTDPSVSSEDSYKMLSEVRRVLKPGSD